MEGKRSPQTTAIWSAMGVSNLGREFPSLQTNCCSRHHIEQRGVVSAESFPIDRLLSQINDWCCFKLLSYGVVCYTATDS